MNNAQQPINMLFIGNSHTYYHAMPKMLEKMAEAGRQQPVHTREITSSGVGLKWHWEKGDAPEVIQNSNWDYVVLQERSTGPLKGNPSMHKYAPLFHETIKNNGSKTILYMTWANRKYPENQAYITKNYKNLAASLQAELAPVGMVWEKILRDQPAIKLYAPDSRHASSAGSYVAALVFYTLIFNASPEGLPGKIVVQNNKVAELSSQIAEFLQKKVAEVLLAVNRT